MKKTALFAAALAAVCFTLSGAEAAKKRAPKKPADAAYEWNLKHIPPPPPQATGAAGTAKKAVHKKHKKHKKAHQKMGKKKH